MPGERDGLPRPGKQVGIHPDEKKLQELIIHDLILLLLDDIAVNTIGIAFLHRFENYHCHILASLCWEL
jgi:hypothetical protein